MKRPQYVFRPNLSDPQHRRAWALLQQVPSAKRKEFLVQAILATEQTDRLEKSIRKVVREELQAVNISKTDFLPGGTDPFGERSAMNKEPRTMQVADAATASRAPENTPAMVKKIGKTTYKVHVHFSNTSTETMSDKIKRMLKNEIQQM